MRIAYVEDNPTNLALVERVASMNQHTIVSYTEGEIALKELKTEKFDLILMDVELAGELSGLQVVRALRVGGLRTPVVAVTAYAMMGDRDKCLEAGCNDYLPKPLPIRELIDLLARYEATIKAGDAIPVPMPVEHSAVTTFSPLDRGAPDKAVEYPAPVAEAVGVAESTAAAASANPSPAPSPAPAAAPSVVSVAPVPVTAEPKTEVEAKPADSPAPASTPVTNVAPAPTSVDSIAAPAPTSVDPIAAPVLTSTTPVAPAAAPTVDAAPTTTPASAAPTEKPTPPATDQTAESTKPNDTKPS